MVLSDERQAFSAGTRPTLVWMVFHLNLMFSSIEGEARPDVIKCCYWPLLRAAEQCRFPIGIEFTGYTLSDIERLNPAWIAKLRELITEGLVEPIASGQAQLIGPLAPAAVNAANLRLGNQTYERLLRQHPALVLVNEQCFSGSKIDHYIEAGYRGFITDWDNAYLANPDWAPTLRYALQLALGPSGRPLPVLWSLTVDFRKFQRLAHESEDIVAYRQWLARQIEGRVLTLNLYCDDVEIFDFRPGRLEAEPRHGGTSEWAVIERLFRDLDTDRRVACRLPSDILAALPPQGPPLTLTTAAIPLPTKKQEKYNVLPWAATGRVEKGESIRVFPLSNWTELDIWFYIYRENIPVVPLYFARPRPIVRRDGTLIMVDDDRMPLEPSEMPEMKSVRFRTLGCYPLTGAIESTACSVPAIIEEMLASRGSERYNRVIDRDAPASMEMKKREGYF